MSVLDLKIEAIRQGRKQQQLARQTKIHPTRLCRILGGWIEPRPEEMAAIREALGLAEAESVDSGQAVAVA